MWNFEKIVLKRTIPFEIYCKFFVAKPFVAVFRIKGSSLYNDFYL